MAAQQHPFGVAHNAAATPSEWTYFEDDRDDAREYILQHGNVGDTVEFIPNNQLGLARYIIVVTNGEKAFRQTHDVYGSLEHSDSSSEGNDGDGEQTDGESSIGSVGGVRVRKRRTRRARNLTRRKRKMTRRKRTLTRRKRKHKRIKRQELKG
jgi:hypothetical protein